MSIPKEPRQLMINIMYLVLTALLALNVSAEVMNAFFTLDKGNTNTIKIVDSQLSSSITALNDLLSDETKAKYRPIQPAISQVQGKVKEFNQYVDALRDELIDAGGDRDGKISDGDFKEGHAGDLSYIRAIKNKDVTTNLLVDKGKGEDLKNKILSTRDELIAIYTKLLRDNKDVFELKDAEVQNKLQNIAGNMPFNVDDESWKKAGDKTSWADFKFRQMPVAAVLPLLSQMQADLKSSEANMVNDMINLAGGKSIVFDKFFPVVQADRSYVVGGESIKAKISVGTYSSTLDPANVSIYAGGSSLNINSDGTADYSITGSGSGQKKIPLKVVVTNPLTGAKTEGDGEFVYEVGSRSVAVSADKMNVFYIGVDNPVTISASGVSSNDVRVSFSGVSGKGSGSKYTVTASTPGEASISVSANGKSLGSFPFRVKRIPDPVARLSNSSGGGMGSGEFKAQGGVGAFLDNFDFEATCQVAGFELVYVPKREDAVPVNNPGARYSEAARRLVSQAKPGDIYYFDNVRAKCPGDNATRKINSMVFKIQ
ncbi:MAG: GldM family protein [Saprospiraceae bacterium]